MEINKLPTIAEYWIVDNLIGNDSIQNTMFLWDPLTDHLNPKCSEVLTNDGGQSTDEHMVKLKSKSGMNQYIKSVHVCL